MYEVHAELLVYVEHSPANFVTKPSTPADRQAVVLRSNEQLVSIGGRKRTPKSAVARLVHVSDDLESGMISLGSLHGIQRGDQFLARSGMLGFWRLGVTQVDQRTSHVKLSPQLFMPQSGLSTINKKDVRKHEYLKLGQQAGLIPKHSIDLEWIWSHHDPLQLSSLKDIAAQMELLIPRWKLRSADREATVVVGKFRGFRLVLRRTWTEYTGPPQQRAQPAAEFDPKLLKTRHEDREFVLFPMKPKPAPGILKSQIPWKKSNSPYHTRDVYLGIGHGYVWFTRGTIPMQDYLRRRFELDDGDDPIQLAADGLLVQDKGTNTAKSTSHILGRFADRAIPFIEEAIKKAGNEPWRAVVSLNRIHTPRSTEILLDLFNSGNEALNRAAGYALIHRPFRRAAKSAYLSMLREHRHVHPVCDACVGFNWKDAISALRVASKQSRSIHTLQAIIEARRKLEDNPINPQLTEAQQSLRMLTRKDRTPEQDKAIATARKLLKESQDAEAANLYALSLALFTTKGNASEARRAGIDILRSRPRATTIKFLEKVADGMHEDHKSKVRDVLKHISQ